MIQMAGFLFAVVLVFDYGQTQFLGHPFPWLTASLVPAGFLVLVGYMWLVPRVTTDRDRLEKRVAELEEKQKPKTSYAYKDSAPTEGRYHADLQPPEKKKQGP